MSGARPVAIDLFAGAGGLSLGFEQAGFDVAAAIEIDPVHCATHAFNFAHCKTICASVTALTGTDIRRLAGMGEAEVAVVFGGAPCQGFSLMGKRALDDARNQLVFHFVRLVIELNPQYFVFENVKGLTLGQHARFLDELIQVMTQAGYKVLLPYKVLNAADFGVPQDRRRLFLIGARMDQAAATYPTPTLPRVTVWDAIGDLPDADQFADLLHSDETPVGWQTKALYAQRLRGLADEGENFGYSRQFDRNRLTSSLRTGHTEVSKQRFLATASGDTEPISHFKKLHPEGLCNTLRAGTDSARGAFTSPRPIHPFLPRVITVREAARLHSYPDWFRFHATKWHGFRQIGNSVPPLLARAVAAQILLALGVPATKPKLPVPLGCTDLLRLHMDAAARHFGVPRTVIAQRLRKSLQTSVSNENLELSYA